MKNKIFALTDYKDKFGSKHFDEPYRSGMDKDLLKKYFLTYGYKLEFENFAKVDLRNTEKYCNSLIIYTSSEDIGYHYKSYIEDVVFALELSGAQVIPTSQFLRANNNKVYMEFLRTILLKDYNFYSNHYGSLKDVLRDSNNLKFPLVIKNAEGASGRGVFLVKSKNELIKKIKKFKDYKSLKADIKDFLRSYKHKGYKRESRYRNKFIIQPFIPNLKNDWKVYVFGDKLFVLNRPIQKGRGIIASGGGYDNYLYGAQASPPDGMLDYCYDVFKKLKVPNLSLDVAFDGSNFFLIEFQALYFGTAGIPYSKEYFQKKDNNWVLVKNDYNVESVYVESITKYIDNSI